MGLTGSTRYGTTGVYRYTDAVASRPKCIPQRCTASLLRMTIWEVIAKNHLTVVSRGVLRLNRTCEGARNAHFGVRDVNSIKVTHTRRKEGTRYVAQFTLQHNTV